jgi:polysaccharide pyruvyl transferase CsaB
MISGWYGSDNAGDDAILEQFIAEIPTRRSRHLYVLSEVPERVQELYGGAGLSAISHRDGLGLMGLARELLNGGLWRRVQEVRQCELFVLGGGGILRDNTYLSNLIRILDEVWMAKLLGRKVAIYAIGAGPFKTALGKWLIARTLGLCNLITVREASSKARLVAIGVPPERVIVGADPGILLAPTPIADTHLREQVIQMAAHPTTAGIFLEEDYTPVDEVASALDKLHRDHKWTFVALPMRCHSGRDDRQLAKVLRERMEYPDAVHIIDVPLTAPELKWAAGQFRFNITVRLHALIFSASMGVPAVAINYEPKVAAFLKSLDLEDCGIDLDGDIAGELVRKALLCAADLSSYRRRLELKLDESRAAAQSIFVLLDQLLDDDPAAVAETSHSVLAPEAIAADRVIGSHEST